MGKWTTNKQIITYQKNTSNYRCGSRFRFWMIYSGCSIIKRSNAYSNMKSKPYLSALSEPRFRLLFAAFLKTDIFLFNLYTTWDHAEKPNFQNTLFLNNGKLRWTYSERYKFSPCWIWRKPLYKSCYEVRKNQFTNSVICSVASSHFIF